MANRPDPLRATLDRLQLNPAVKEDRPYLVTVLRRLGYSVTEADLDDWERGERRVVEVEYDKDWAPRTTFEIQGTVLEDLQEFRLVSPDDEVFEFRLIDSEDVERPIEETGDWDRAAGAAAAGSPEEWEGSEAWPEERDGEADWQTVEEGPAPWLAAEEEPEGAAGAAATDATDATDTGWQPAEEERGWQPVEEEVAWPEEALEAPETVQEEDEEVAPWPETAPEAARPTTPVPWPKQGRQDGGHRHGPYTLCTREVELTAGDLERIYFFAKQVPQGWTPCDIPDGFVVKENERTKLPYLERQ